MKLFVCTFSALLLIIARETNAQTFQNDVSFNSCFYTTGRRYSGTLLAQLNLNGDAIPSCCNLCRGLDGCVAWTWDSLTCFLYKNVTSINYNFYADYSSGKTSELPIWECNETQNKWFYEAKLNWIAKPGLVNSPICCEACFITYECMSYMFDTKTNTCYHSTRNYLTSASIEILGMFTGSPSISMIP